MLLRQEFRGGHEGALEAAAHGPEERQGGNHRLPRPYVSLEEPKHGLGSIQIGGELRADPALGLRELEGQGAQEARLEGRIPGKAGRGLGLEDGAGRHHGQLMGEQFVKGQALLGRIEACLKGCQIRPHGGRMEMAKIG
jgi:hypothetical protein